MTYTRHAIKSLGTYSKVLLDWKGERERKTRNCCPHDSLLLFHSHLVSSWVYSLLYFSLYFSLSHSKWELEGGQKFVPLQLTLKANSVRKEERLSIKKWIFKKISYKRKKCSKKNLFFFRRLLLRILWFKTSSWKRRTNVRNQRSLLPLSATFKCLFYSLLIMPASEDVSQETEWRCCFTPLLYFPSSTSSVSPFIYSTRE